jgi:phosphoglycerate kinase
MQEELDALTKVLETPTRPLAAIVGEPRCRPSSTCSATCSPKVDILVIGGGMANTFLAAQGMRSASRCASTTLAHRARDHGRGEGQRPRSRLPVDAVVAKAFAAKAPSRVVAVDSVAPDEMIWISARAASSMSAPCWPG